SQSPRDAEQCATRADAGRPAVDTAADGVEQLSGSDGRMPERSAHDCAACTHLPLVISTTGALGLRRLGTRRLDDGASRRDPSRTPPWLIFGRAHPRCGIAPPLVFDRCGPRPPSKPRRETPDFRAFVKVKRRIM